MALFRKKPVVIEAMQYLPGGRLEVESWMIGHGAQDQYCVVNFNPAIQTLEGTMEASPGDWIIKGVNGEFYPCKDDIFQKTYEAV